MTADRIRHQLSFAVRFNDHFSGAAVSDELPVRLAGNLQRPARRQDGAGMRQSDGSYRFLGVPGGPARLLWRDPFARTQSGWSRFGAEPEVMLPLANPASPVPFDLWPAANAAAPSGAIGIRGKLTGPESAGQTIRIAHQSAAFDRHTISDQNGEFLFLPQGRQAEDPSGQVPMTIEVTRPDTSPRVLAGGAAFTIPPGTISRLIFTLV